MSDTTPLFDLLADPRRRRILLLLCGTDSLRVPEGLRKRGAARTEGDRSPLRPGTDGDGVPDTSPVDPGDARPLELALIHCRLPKLEAEACLEWDRGARTVPRGPDFERIEPALRVLLANADAFPDPLL